MSRSPLSENNLAARQGFEKALDSLDEMIFEGFSFSGNEPNCGFINLEGRGFANVSSVAGLDLRDDGRAVAVVDWDRDGDLDLWFQNRTGPQLRLMRNESPGDRNWAAFQLEGTRSNRDGIGARLEIRIDGQPPLVRTLHAGDGFLAQSSRWVHFGLGDAKKIGSLEIHWPSGTRQQLDSIEVNRRYRIVEGRNTPQLWEGPGTKQQLKPKAWKGPVNSGQSRVVMAAPAPLPQLRYGDFGGGAKLLETSGSPLLLNLWASWCAPCVGELRDFQSHWDRFQKKGLGVLALSVDGLGDDGSSADQARRFSERLGLRFPVGMATRDLLEKLELLHHALLDWRRPFPVPTSFLIDDRGRLLAVYRGTVAAEQVLLDLDNAGRFETVVPFPGRWFSEKRILSLSNLAQRFLDKGQLEEAERYLDMARDQMEKTAGLQDPEYGPGRNALGLRWMEAGNPQRALSQLQEALRVQPDSVRAQTNLGILLVSTGHPQQALAYFEKALEKSPRDAEVLSNLGLALMQAGRSEEAVARLRRALSLEPGLAKTRYTLGLALTRLGRLEEAADSYGRAIQQHPEFSEAEAALAWLLSTHPNAEFRDGPRALLLAESAVKQQDEPAPGFLEVLAAALAENGKFREAEATADEALRLARQQGRNDLIETIEQGRNLYRRGAPFRLKLPR